MQVSVIIPYYNSEKTIIRALESVVKQTYGDYEIILIDDGSLDNSYNIVEEFRKKTNLDIKNIHQKNMGPSIARNVGIKLSRGKYIAFLDSDDEWLPEKLEKQIEIMEANDMEMLGCNYFLIKDDKREKFVFTSETLRKIDFRKLLFKHYFATPCVVIKRDILLESGMFPEHQSFMEDSYLFTNIARKYRTFMSNDFLVNIYKLPYGESGLSKRLYEMEKYELSNFKKFREENSAYKEKLGLILYALALLFSYAKYIRRKLVVKLRNR